MFMYYLQVEKKSSRKLDDEVENSRGLKSNPQYRAGLKSKPDEAAQGPVQLRSEDLQGQRC